jgi:hypothetical protein
MYTIWYIIKLCCVRAIFVVRLVRITVSCVVRVVHVRGVLKGGDRIC